MCATPVYERALSPVNMRNIGMGGVLSTSYARSGCASRHCLKQCQCTIAGCTHIASYKVLKHALGVEAVTFQTFQSTIKGMYLIVVGMIDGMCE